MGALFTRLNLQANLEMIREGARFYSSFGYTTAQDGRSSTGLGGRGDGGGDLDRLGGVPVPVQGAAVCVGVTTATGRPAAHAY